MMGLRLFPSSRISSDALSDPVGPGPFTMDSVPFWSQGFGEAMRDMAASFELIPSSIPAQLLLKAPQGSGA